MKSKLKRAGNCGLRGMYRKLISHMTLMETGCINTRVMCVVSRDMPTKAAVQFLSEMARSASCLWTVLVVLLSILPLV